MKTFRTMLKTELKLSLRGMDMFIFAICVPVVVLVILGIIYGEKPAYPGAVSYTHLDVYKRQPAGRETDRDIIL